MAPGVATSISSQPPQPTSPRKGTSVPGFRPKRKALRRPEAYTLERFAFGSPL